MRVLILGAGYGGLTVAHKLRKYARELEVTVVSNSSIVRENTIFPLLLTGEVSPEETEFNAKEAMERKGVEFVEGRVRDINPESNEVSTTSGTFDYDYLVVGLGGSYEENFSSIPGHEHAFMHHTLDGFLGLKKTLESTEDGATVFVGNVQGSPIEGPSYQVALLSKYLLDRRGLKSTVYLSTSSSRGVFGTIPAEWVSETANRLFEKRGVVILKGVTVKEVSKDGVLLSNGDEVEAPIKSILPRLSAPEPIVRAGLTDRSGFMDVEHPTFRSVKFRNVFGVGDAVKGMVPPKTARAAMVSGENVASTILKEVRGISLPYFGQGVLCMLAGGEIAGMLRFDPTPHGVKLALAWGEVFKNLKKAYSRLLVRKAFDVPFHAAPVIKNGGSKGA